MGLVAAVSKFPARNGKEKRGDIIVVKLEDSPWGDMEVKEFTRIFLDDVALEARLAEARLKGEPHPVIAYPYAKRDAEGMIMARSDRQFDVDAISDACVERAKLTREQVLDFDTPTPVLSAGPTLYKFKIAAPAKEIAIEEVARG